MAQGACKGSRCITHEPCRVRALPQTHIVREHRDTDGQEGRVADNCTRASSVGKEGASIKGHMLVLVDVGPWSGPIEVPLHPQLQGLGLEVGSWL